MTLRIRIDTVRLVMLLGLLGGLLADPAGAAKSDQPLPMQVICAPERPLLHPGESVTVTAWVSNASNQPLDHAPNLSWSTGSGSITGNGDTARWSVSSAPVVVGNSVTARAVVTARRGSSMADCQLQVLIVAPPRPEDTKGVPFGRALLLPTAIEPAGYGLTSYLLLKQPAHDDEERQRHLKAIEAVLLALAPIEELLQIPDVRPSQLNITLLPVRRRVKLPDPLTAANVAQAAQLVLDAYDYARAQVLLGQLDDKAERSGPYLASRTPAVAPAKATPLFWNLSHVAPKLVRDWISTYCALAGQESSWSDVTLKKLSLNTRNAIAVGARTTPDVIGSLEQWMRLLSPK